MMPALLKCSSTNSSRKAMEATFSSCLKILNQGEDKIMFLIETYGCIS